MQDDAFIVVFPTEFSRSRIHTLMENIRKVLTQREEKFQSIKRDSDVVIVQANDPVFASSAINQLFGIDKVAIARRTQNDLESVVSEITKLGGNLLLRGEKFLVKVEGTVKGFVPKDAEMAATSSIIENKSQLGATPGSENRYDKLLYTYITKKSAYVCIFLDQGHCGMPNLYQEQKIICPIFDEISAVSCIETIKQGFDVKIIVIYKKRSDLVKLAKMLSRIIVLMLRSEIDLEFYSFDSKLKASDRYNFLSSVVQLCTIVAVSSKINRVALPMSSRIFPIGFVDNIAAFVQKSGLTPHFVLQGLEDGIRDTAGEFVLEKFFGKINTYTNTEFSNTEQAQFRNSAVRASRTKQCVTVKIGPNNVHDILDALE